jgi:hypothetical protein
MYLFAQIQSPPGGDSPDSGTPTATADASPPAPTSPSSTLDPLTPGQKAARRARQLVEPLGLLNSAAAAGIDLLADVPHQWGQGMEGYGIRFASAEGISAARNGISLGFDIALHIDPRYRPMPQGKTSSRIWNAVSQTLIANKDSGGKIFNFSEVAGNFGAGFIANTWEPPGHNAPGDALMRGATGLGFRALKNVGREFLPELWHRVRSGHT